MAKLDDIRGCKIRVSSKTESAMVQETAFEFGFTNKLGNKIPDVKHASFYLFL